MINHLEHIYHISTGHRKKYDHLAIVLRIVTMSLQGNSSWSNISVNLTDTAGSTEFSSAQLQIIIVFTTCIAVLGTVTNSLTIASIISGKLHRQACYIKILNLNICNLIHCVIFLPLLAAQALTGLWTDNTLMCNAVSYGLFSNLGTELWGYVCISLNRYLRLANRNLHDCLYGNLKLVALEWALTWSIYPIILAPPLFGVWSEYRYWPRKLVCHPFSNNGLDCTGYCLFVFLLAFLTTIPVIVYCYLHIIYIYIKIRNKVNISRESSSTKKISKISNEGSPHREIHLTKSEAKMAFTILAVILVFAVCRMPFILLYMYDPTMTKVDPLVHSALIYAGTNSYWINPIIYCLTNRKIRNAFLRLKNKWCNRFNVCSK